MNHNFDTDIAKATTNTPQNGNQGELLSAML